VPQRNTEKNFREQSQTGSSLFLSGRQRQSVGLHRFDMKDTSQIPAIAEPWVLAFNAKVSLRPVMTPEDLSKAGSSIGKAVKKYGK
jgi:hypothetical protein